MGIEVEAEAEMGRGKKERGGKVDVKGCEGRQGEWSM